MGGIERSDVPDLPDRIIAATALYLNVPLRELHKKDDPIVKWFDKGFPQTTLANGEVD